MNLLKGTFLFNIIFHSEREMQGVSISVVFRNNPFSHLHVG